MSIYTVLTRYLSIYLGWPITAIVFFIFMSVCVWLVPYFLIYRMGGAIVPKSSYLYGVLTNIMSWSLKDVQFYQSKKYNDDIFFIPTFFSGGKLVVGGDKYLGKGFSKLLFKDTRNLSYILLCAAQLPLVLIAEFFLKHALKVREIKQLQGVVTLMMNIVEFILFSFFIYNFSLSKKSSLEYGFCNFINSEGWRSYEIKAFYEAFRINSPA